MAPLPTDVATLQAMVLSHAADLAEVRSARLAQDTALAAARAGIIEQRFEIEALKARLAKLLRATFGRSSEKLRDQVEQLELVLSDIDEMLAETAPSGPAADADLVPVAGAHARRKFWDVHEKTKSALSREALDRIAPLYKIEATIRGRTPGQRLAVRVEHTKPLLAELHDWMHATLGRISGRSEMAKALRYSLNRWDALTLILRDGRACIDNSAAERVMRPIALGRRNWTFAGSDAGGARAAAIYSLIETAKANGFDPEDYLRRLIQQIADHPVNRIDELLPWNLHSVRARLDQRLAA